MISGSIARIAAGVPRTTIAFSSGAGSTASSSETKPPPPPDLAEPDAPEAGSGFMPSAEPTPEDPVICVLPVFWLNEPNPPDPPKLLEPPNPVAVEA